MSFQAMTWAVDQQCQNAGQKLVLLLLSNYCNGHTGQCNPSHKRLADECCIGVSTLKTHLKALEDMGLLSIIHKASDGVQLPNQYMLKIGGVGQNLAGGGSESDGGVGQNLATNQEDKPRIEPEGEQRKRSHSPDHEKAKTLTAYLADCKASKSKPVHDGHHIRQWATDAGITPDMLQIAWLQFRERYTESEKGKSKRYKDWPGHFATAVKANWFKLWFLGDGGMQWTTTGMTHKAVLDARMKPQETIHAG